MFVNGEFKVSVRRRVDETNTMFLSGCKRHIVILPRSVKSVLSLNKTSISRDRKTREFFLKEELRGRSMEPIRNGKRPEVDIPVGT